VIEGEEELMKDPRVIALLARQARALRELWDK
jgi:hypothetical protein